MSVYYLSKTVTRPMDETIELVTTRPKLRAKFAEVTAWKAEYAEMQARGEGVN